MAGVALCAIDGLLVWRVLGLVTSTLCSCGFPKAGLPSWSGPFPVALIPCSLLSLVVRLARSAAQVTSPSKRTFLACLLFICFAVLLALGCPFWPLSSPNPSKPTYSAARILQNGPRQLRLLGCAPCSPSLWWSVLAAQQPESFKTDLLSSPNPSKRTSPAWSPWLSPLLSLWWSVSAAQQPNSFKTDLASLLCWAGAVLLALALVVRFGRSAAQIFQNGLRQLGLLGCPPALAPVVRFGRSAAQILQSGPHQLRLDR